MAEALKVGRASGERRTNTRQLEQTCTYEWLSAQLSINWLFGYGHVDGYSSLFLE